jgi:hypothetical protein
MVTVSMVMYFYTYSGYHGTIFIFHYQLLKEKKKARDMMEKTMVNRIIILANEINSERKATYQIQ